VAQRLAEQARALRLERGWSRGELAERAGLSEETVKSFERRAQITLSRLLLIARALDALEDFASLFAPRLAESLAEIEARQRPRLRGRRSRSLPVIDQVRSSVADFRKIARGLSVAAATVTQVARRLDEVGAQLGGGARESPQGRARRKI